MEFHYNKLDTPLGRAWWEGVGAHCRNVEYEMLTQCLSGNVKCAVLVWTVAARCCELDGSEGKSLSMTVLEAKKFKLKTIQHLVFSF